MHHISYQSTKGLIIQTSIQLVCVLPLTFINENDKILRNKCRFQNKNT